MRTRHPVAIVAGLLAFSAVLASTACDRSRASVPLADVTANEHGFTPSSMKLAAGGPGSHETVTFVRTSDKTCATEVVFPDLHIDKKLPLDQVVAVDLPTNQARTLSFQCGMGMYKGAVLVTAK